MSKTVLDDFLYSMLTKSSDFTRNQGVYTAKPELLSEHLVEVQVVGYQIIKYMRHHGITSDIDERVYLEKSLLHDLDEVVTGDIPRNTKYHSKEVKKALDEVASDALDLIETHYEYLSGIKDFVLNTKKGKEGWILKVVDLLVVYRRSMIEIEVRGNLSPLRIMKELTEHISLMKESILSTEDLSESEKKFLNEILSEALANSQCVVSRNEYLIDKYSFIENKLSIYKK